MVGCGERGDMKLGIAELSAMIDDHDQIRVLSSVKVDLAPRRLPFSSSGIRLAFKPTTFSLSAQHSIRLLPSTSMSGTHPQQS